MSYAVSGGTLNPTHSLTVMWQRGPVELLVAR